MAREHLLCVADGIDGFGIRRKFSVYETRGCGFILCNDRGHRHISHGLLKPIECDIRREILDVYGVADVTIEGSILHGKISFTWPLGCANCANCGCEPTRRSYGGRFAGNVYCLFCLKVTKLKDNIKEWTFDRPETWGHSSAGECRTLDEFEIYISEIRTIAECRLSQLRTIEAKRQGKIPIDDADMESLRSAVLKRLRRKNALLSHDTFPATRFSAEQLQIVFSMFAELVESVPWRFPWWDSQEQILAHRAKLA